MSMMSAISAVNQANKTAMRRFCRIYFHSVMNVSRRHPTLSAAALRRSCISSGYPPADGAVIIMRKMLGVNTSVLSHDILTCHAHKAVVTELGLCSAKAMGFSRLLGDDP